MPCNILYCRIGNKKYEIGTITHKSPIIKRGKSKQCKYDLITIYTGDLKNFPKDFLDEHPVPEKVITWTSEEMDGYFVKSKSKAGQSLFFK